jgi:hypothetical protein
VPHPTTVMKLTTRRGSAGVDGFNEALSARPAESKVLRTNRIRADTMVALANTCIRLTRGCWPRRYVGSLRRVSRSLSLQEVQQRFETLHAQHVSQTVVAAKASEPCDRSRCQLGGFEIPILHPPGQATEDLQLVADGGGRVTPLRQPHWATATSGSNRRGFLRVPDMTRLCPGAPCSDTRSLRTRWN